MPAVLRSESAVEFLQRLARPEDLLEAVEREVHALVGDHLVDDDRPGPDRGDDQADHHELDDETGLHEQAPDGVIAARRGQYCGFHVFTS
jgi:hypothetical protein